MSKIIYPERESKFLEFKSKLPTFLALTKTCIAFANGVGGRIIIGVDDETREVVGASHHDRERVYNDFQNSLFDSVHPNLYAQIYQQNYNDRLTVIIDVPQCNKKPYFLKSAGMAKGTYVRLGSSTRKANQEFIDDLMREAERLPYDEEVIQQPLSILSKELLEYFYDGAATKKLLRADKIIGTKSANREKDAPTVAGALMFCEEPQRYIPEAIVICSQFKGNEGREIIRTEEIVGTVQQQGILAFDLVRSWIERDYKLVGTKLKGTLLIPEAALREAITNALIHRKYTIPGATKIALYDRRLEIFSPGCFPGMIDINTLGDGITYLRNPNLAKLARKIRMIEKFGTGIRLIFQECKKAKLRAPEYHEEGDFVKIVFSFEPDISMLKDDDTAILEFIKMNDSVAAIEVATFLGITRNSAARKIRGLVNSHKIVRVGQGRATRYRLK